ncbi:MAG: hypothetical protein P1P64_02915 [Treponemataceae bacterium]
MTIQEALEKNILLDYQKKWLIDNSEVKLWEKSRRIGASYVEALYSVLLAALSRLDGGMSCYYLSYAKEMTQQFINDCAFWAKLLNIACSDMEEVLLKDEDKDITVYKIRFDSGFEIWGLPSVPRSLRSKQGHVVIDEAAFVDDLTELMKAALALLMWGGSVSILSTHNGEDNPFNELIKEIHEGKKNYSHHRTTISDALDDGLYKRICEVSGRKWSKEKEVKWLDDLIKNYGEGADEELFCNPSISGAKYFSRALIDSVIENVPVFRFAENDAFTFESEWKRERKINKWFKEIKPTLLSTDNAVVMGEDFARSGDLTVIWLDEIVKEGETKTLCVIELRNIPFAQQWQMIKLIGNTLKNFEGAAFDSRGNGQMIAEYAAQEWAGYVYQVMLTRKWYAENFPQLKSTFEDKSTTIPTDFFIRNDFSAVKIVQGVPLITERSGSTGDKRHGDACIAKVMANFAERQSYEANYQPYKYESVKIKNRFNSRGIDIWANWND